MKIDCGQATWISESDKLCIVVGIIIVVIASVAMLLWL